MLLFGVALAAGILRFIQRRTIQGVARQMEFHLRADFFLHLQKLSAAYYDNVRTGDLMTRATSDLNAIRMVLSSAVMYTADAIVFFGLALTIMLRIDAGLTLVTLLAISSARTPDSISWKTVACTVMSESKRRSQH